MFHDSLQAGGGIAVEDAEGIVRTTSAAELAWHLPNKLFAGIVCIKDSKAWVAEKVAVAARRERLGLLVSATDAECEQKEVGLVWTRFYSITCLHIHRLFPKGGHQHWLFGHDIRAIVTHEFLGFGIFVLCRCPDRVSAQLPSRLVA